MKWQEYFASPRFHAWSEIRKKVLSGKMTREEAKNLLSKVSKEGYSTSKR